MLTAVASLIARAHARKNRCRGEHWSIVRVYEYPARAGMHLWNSGWPTSNIGMETSSAGRRPGGRASGRAGGRTGGQASGR